MLNKVKVLKSAEKYVIERRFRQAVTEYQRLLEVEPDEPTLLNTVGDLLIREERREEALKNFRRVVDIYLNGGFTLKAIAMLKKVLRTASDDLKAREQLSKLYEKQGLRFDATRELNVLVQQHEQAGHTDKALDALKRLQRVDPSNADVWLRSAQLLERTADKNSAVDAYLEAVQRYKQKGEFERVYDISLQGLRVMGTQRDLLGALVESATATERLDSAESFLNERITSTDQEFPYRLYVAQILERKGKANEAGHIFLQLQKDGFVDDLISEGLVRTDRASVVISGSESSASVDDVVFNAPAQTEFTRPSDYWDSPKISGPDEDAGGSGVFAISPGDDAAQFLGDRSPDEGVFSVTSEEPEEDTEDDEGPSAAVPVEEELQISSLDEALEEADFYLKLGFQEDARQLLQKLLDRFPSDERVLRRAQKVMLVPPGPAAGTPAPVVDTLSVPAPESPPLEGRFEGEIESALDSLFTGEDLVGALDEVLRYDIAGNGHQEGETPKTHYDLGLAYKEMGLVEDAIREFKQAYSMGGNPLENPQKILCCSMLASSYLQVRDFTEAEKWASEGLGIPEKKDFEWKALEYDLASAYAEQERPGEALDLFLQILERDAEYRDVTNRVATLRTRVDDQ